MMSIDVTVTDRHVLHVTVTDRHVLHRNNYTQSGGVDRGHPSWATSLGHAAADLVSGAAAEGKARLHRPDGIGFNDQRQAVGSKRCWLSASFSGAPRVCRLRLSGETA
jgi:hypothetical protein